jgi:hypothetical protein
LERFASGFFVQIHAFAILDNHFILLTGLNLDAQQASKKELLQRHQKLYPKESEPPPGSYKPDGTLVPDEDNGIERLRERLGSVSRFVQELKQRMVQKEQTLTSTLAAYETVSEIERSLCLLRYHRKYRQSAKVLT